jgi:hypothetical protein
VNEVGLPFHVPSEVISVWPTAAVPVITGRPVLLGVTCVLAEPTGETRSATIATAKRSAKPA